MSELHRLAEANTDGHSLAVFSTPHPADTRPVRAQHQNEHDPFDGSANDMAFYNLEQATRPASELGKGSQELVDYPSNKRFSRLGSA